LAQSGSAADGWLVAEMSSESPIEKERRNIAELLRDWPPTVVDAVIDEMLLLWQAENLKERITWRWNARLRTTIGRAMLDDMVLELNPLLLGRNPEEMRGVVVHELAHLVTTNRYGFRVPPHGNEWKSLMRAAGESTRATHSLDVEGLRAKPTRRRRRRRARVFPFLMLCLFLPLMSCASSANDCRDCDDCANRPVEEHQVGILVLRDEVDMGYPGADLLDDGFGDSWFGDERYFALSEVHIVENENASTKMYNIAFSIVDSQTQEFSDFTASMVGRKMAIIVDGKLIAAPIVNDRLPGKGIISGGSQGWSAEEADSLIAQIQNAE
jgi:predicted SprT family Zn-dependent metalloprotease